MDDDDKLAGKSGINAQLVLEDRADACWQGSGDLGGVASALFACASAFYDISNTLGDIEDNLRRIADALEAKEA